ncbi:MAG: hypothetical protein GY804_00375 [Alphaproteobacteria bacterium]|nr:hypothetical protein [Alphaproteobacteria bacterium]
MLPDLNSKLKAQGFYLEMLEALIRNAINAEANKANLPRALWKTWNDYNIPIIEKAWYPKKWEEIRSYYE